MNEYTIQAIVPKTCHLVKRTKRTNTLIKCFSQDDQVCCLFVTQIHKLHMHALAHAQPHPSRIKKKQRRFPGRTQYQWKHVQPNIHAVPTTHRHAEAGRPVLERRKCKLHHHHRHDGQHRHYGARKPDSDNGCSGEVEKGHCGFIHCSTTRCTLFLVHF